MATGGWTPGAVGGGPYRIHGGGRTTYTGQPPHAMCALPQARNCSPGWPQSGSETEADTPVDSATDALAYAATWRPCAARPGPVLRLVERTPGGRGSGPGGGVGRWRLGPWRCLPAGPSTRCRSFAAAPGCNQPTHGRGPETMPDTPEERLEHWSNTFAGLGLEPLFHRDPPMIVMLPTSQDRSVLGQMYMLLASKMYAYGQRMVAEAAETMLAQTPAPVEVQTAPAPLPTGGYPPPYAPAAPVPGAAYPAPAPVPAAPAPTPYVPPAPTVNRPPAAPAAPIIPRAPAPLQRPVPPGPPPAMRQAAPQPPPGPGFA